jgi:hypothetical protein
MGSYKFILKQNGAFFVRFHFFSFKAQSFDLKDANFSFIVGGKLVMNNFNVNFKHSSNDSNDAIIKEFILKVESNLLEIVFRPVNDSGFGFVNRIEVFSAPEDFVVDYGSRFVGPFGVKEYKNLSLKKINIEFLAIIMSSTT